MPIANIKNNLLRRTCMIASSVILIPFIIAYSVFEGLDCFFREFIQVWKQHD